MLAPNNCALFIGVENYSVFDVSLGQKLGTSDLSGARVDALAFFKICIDMGIPAENMRILTAPKLTPEEAGAIPATCLGDATAASSVEGATWLSERMGTPNGPPGLLTYSGHGDWLEGQGLVLCPSDTSGPNLKNALPYSKIEGIFGTRGVAGNLTTLLDTCHSGSGTAGGTKRHSSSLTGRTLPSRMVGEIRHLGDRLLAACEADQLAWRSKFSGVWRGAFSWAVGATLEQWTARMDGENVELNLSYGELLERTNKLLLALSFEQTAVLQGRPGTARTPFFHSGPGGANEETSKDPTASDTPEQIDPQVKIGLSLSWYPSATWEIVSNGVSPPSGSGYNAWTEVWAVDSNFVNQLGGARPGDTLTMTPQTFREPWPAGAFTNPTASLWTQLGSAPSGDVFAYSDTGSNTFVALTFNLTAGTPWTGAVNWLAAAPTGGSGPPTSIVGSSTISFTYSSSLPTLPTGYSWFYMRLPALTWPNSPSRIGETTSGMALTTLTTTAFLADVISGGSQNGHLSVRSSTDGVTWSNAATTSVTDAQFAPGFASLGETLFLLYSDTSNPNQLRQITSLDGVNWTSSTNTGATSSGSPSLATVEASENILCLAYQSNSNSAHIHTRAWDGRNWSSATTAATNAAAAPSLASLNGSLYAAVATSNNIQIFQASSVSTSGITWSSSAVATITPPSGARWNNPHLGTWQGQLVLSFFDADSQLWACFSEDGVMWSGFQNLSSQIPSVTTTLAPAVGSLGTTLVIGFEGTTSPTTGLCTLAAT